jgi:CheY-like chemotaxis protein
MLSPVGLSNRERIRKAGVRSGVHISGSAVEIRALERRLGERRCWRNPIYAMDPGRGRMTERPILYVLSDDDAVRDSIDALFQAKDMPVRTFDSPAALLQDLAAMSYGCLLIDINANGSDPFGLLNQLRARGLSLPAIILVHQESAGGVLSNNAKILRNPITADALAAAVENALFPPRQS